MYIVIYKISIHCVFTVTVAGVEKDEAVQRRSVPLLSQSTVQPASWRDEGAA